MWGEYEKSPGHTAGQACRWPYTTTAFGLITTMAGGSTHLTSIAPRANQPHDGLHLTLRFGAAVIPHCGCRPSGLVSEFLLGFRFIVRLHLSSLVRSFSLILDPLQQIFLEVRPNLHQDRSFTALASLATLAGAWRRSISPPSFATSLGLLLLLTLRSFSAARVRAIIEAIILSSLLQSFAIVALLRFVLVYSLSYRCFHFLPASDPLDHCWLRIICTQALLPV